MYSWEESWLQIIKYNKIPTKQKISAFVVVVKGNINCDLIALINIHIEHNCKYTHTHTHTHTQSHTLTLPFKYPINWWIEDYYQTLNTYHVQGSNCIKTLSI